MQPLKIPIIVWLWNYPINIVWAYIDYKLKEQASNLDFQYLKNQRDKKAIG